MNQRRNRRSKLGIGVSRTDRRRWRVISLLCASALVLAACSGQSSSTTQAPSGDSATTDDPGASTSTDAGDRAVGGTLRFGFYQSPQLGFNPFTSEGVYSQVALNIVYDRLVHVTPQGEAVPGLAESWEFVDDGTTLRLHLRDDVVFQDGEPFDAEAVRVNLGRAVVAPELETELAAISSVDVVDGLTVDVHLSEPAANIILSLSGKGGMMVSPAAIDNPDLDVNPVGAGGWKLVEYDPGASIAFERFEDYWDPDSNLLQRIEYYTITDDETRLIGLETDELDLINVAESQIDGIKSTNGLDVVMTTSIPFYGIILNRSRPPFDDVRVRQAIAYGIDREAIVDGLLFGYGEPGVSFFPQGYFAYPSDIDEGIYAYDPDRARQLLEEAGYGDGLSIDFATFQSGSYPVWAEAVQDMLAQIGVDMKITVLDPPAWTQYWLVDETADAAATRASAPDPSILLRTHYLADGSRNAGGATTDEMVSLLDQSIATYDPAERAQILQDIEKQAIEEAWNVPLWHGLSPFGFNTKVKGFESWANSIPEFRGVYIDE